MECRISLLLGRPPSEVRAMPVSDIQQLSAYWAEEPWGPLRDNMHAGMIAAAVGNYSAKKLQRPLRWQDFWLRTKEAEQAGNRGALLSMLRAIARPRAKGAKVKPRD